MKLFKKGLVLLLVILLTANNYAAVSSNDGSAFVTKAEFDALVNTFNEQMDNYEASLVSKVDGAIANYLAGMSNKISINIPWPLSVVTEGGTSFYIYNPARFTKTAPGKNYDYTSYSVWAWNGGHHERNMTVGSGVFQEKITSSNAIGTMIEISDNGYMENYYGTYYLMDTVTGMGFSTEGACPYGRHLIFNSETNLGTYVYNSGVMYCTELTSSSRKRQAVYSQQYLRDISVKKSSHTGLINADFYSNATVFSNLSNVIKSSEKTINSTMWKRGRGSTSLVFSTSSSNGSTLADWYPANSEACWATSTETSKSFKGYTIWTYPHELKDVSLKYTEKQFNTLYMNSVSNAWGENVTVGKGIPIFKAPEDGRATFIISYNSATPIYMAIKSSPFTHGASAFVAENMVNADYTINGAKLTRKVFEGGAYSNPTPVTISFNVTRNVTYYLGIGNQSPGTANNYTVLSGATQVAFESSGD